VKYHVTHGFESKPFSHTYNLSSKPKSKKSPIKVHDGFTTALIQIGFIKSRSNP